MSQELEINGFYLMEMRPGILLNKILFQAPVVLPDKIQLDNDQNDLILSDTMKYQYALSRNS